MLRIDWMKPHESTPAPHKIEVDISGILVRPEKFTPPGLNPDREAGNTFPKQTDRSFDARESRIGPFEWTSINFVAISVLIAFFCTVFIRDTFEYSRRRAHLPADASDLKPEFSLTKSQGFSLEPSRLGATGQLDRLKTSWSEENASGNESPALSTVPQFRSDQTLAPSPNSTALANASSTDNSRSVSADSALPSRLSGTTSSNAEDASGGEQTSSKSSSMRTVIRHSRKSMTSSRTTISRHRQSIRHALANNVRNIGVHNSAPRATRENAGGLSLNTHSRQGPAAKTQMAVTPSLMSMHSLGNGGALRQIHGAMNPMHMESGMLAQPAIGAGLGGVSSNGFGGGGGNRAAK